MPTKQTTRTNPHPYRKFISLEDLQKCLVSANYTEVHLSVRIYFLHVPEGETIVKLMLLQNGIEVVRSSKVSDLLDWIKEEFGLRWMRDNDFLSTKDVGSVESKTKREIQQFVYFTD